MKDGLLLHQKEVSSIGVHKYIEFEFVHANCYTNKKLLLLIAKGRCRYSLIDIYYAATLFCTQIKATRPMKLSVIKRLDKAFHIEFVGIDQPYLLARGKLRVK